MKTGFNLLLWTTHVTEEHHPVLKTLAETGYDGAELPIFGGELDHYKQLAKVLDDYGLDRTAVTVIPDQEHNPLSPDAAHRQGAVDHLAHVLDCAAAAGVEVVCGPMHQPLGEFTGEPPTEDEKQRGAEVHRKAAEMAAERGIVLAIEYLNRFEAYFINTMADAADYVRRVDHPNFGTMYDSFHANIEEKDPVGVIETHKDVNRHIHISANDRGTPGRGHLDWDAIFGAIRRSGYDGWLTIEAFSRALPDLAAATRCWRDFFPSKDQVYTEGLELIRKHIA